PLTTFTSCDGSCNALALRERGLYGGHLKAALSVAALYERRQSHTRDNTGGPRSASAIARSFKNRPPRQQHEIIGALSCLLLLATTPLHAQQAATPKRASDYINEQMPHWLRV